LAIGGSVGLAVVSGIIDDTFQGLSIFLVFATLWHVQLVWHVLTLIAIRPCTRNMAMGKLDEAREVHQGKPRAKEAEMDLPGRNPLHKRLC
jgi:hypothetical protein